MTTVSIFRNKADNILGFSAQGHADNQSEKGFDIFCAAISAITQTACIGLEQVAQKKVKLKIRDGFLSAFVSEEDAEDIRCKTIFKTMILGLQSFNEANPGYIQILEEVR